VTGPAASCAKTCYNKELDAIDPVLFSPAEARLTSSESGRTFHAGQLNQDVLRAPCYPA
jgi:methenyltetrahydromethanopterin cyclohydrolase